MPNHLLASWNTWTYWLQPFQQCAIFLMHLKESILLAQPLEQSSCSIAPDFLLCSITAFLSDALGLPEDVMEESWEILKDYVWKCEKVELTKEDYEAFKEYGWARGVSTSQNTNYAIIKTNKCEAAHTVYPPTNVYTNESCLNKSPLKKETSRWVLVYTVAHGVQPTWAVHVYCTHMYISTCQFLWLVLYLSHTMPLSVSNSLP